ncbi:thiol-disulfide oxidoreductase DCC family protein [Spirosoma humi]
MNATIIFDGACGVCNAYVQFVIQRDPAGYFSFVSAQSIRGQQLRKTVGDVSADSIMLIEGNSVSLKSEAVIRIARRLTGYWRWIWWFRWLPRAPLDAFYDKFARNRYRFGSATSCRLLTPDQQNRILIADNQ